jgi:hypothetical protein
MPEDGTAHDSPDVTPVIDKQPASPDVFMLYNSKQAGVGQVVEGLRARGISVWYSVDSLGAGDDWDKRETRALDAALTAVALVGQEGWGAYQQSYTERAVAMDKLVIPAVLIDANAQDFGRASGLFHRVKRVHFKAADDPEALAEIVNAVRRRKPSQESGRHVADEARVKKLRPEVILRQLMSSDPDDRELMLDELARLATERDLAPLLADEMDRGLGAVASDTTKVEIRATLAEALGITLARSGELREAALRGWDLPHAQFRFAAGVFRVRSDAEVTTLYGSIQPLEPRVAELVAAVRERHEHARVEHLRRLLLEDPALALEMLRVVAVPQLALDLLALLSRQATVPAIVALSHPELARSVVEVLGEDAHFQQLMSVLCQVADFKQRFVFARILRLLSAFPEAKVKSALTALIDASPSSAAGAQLLFDGLDDDRFVVAGFRSEGRDDTPDDLGVATDVQTLCSVILSRDVSPPLSIGLFGDWGAGKSFFMDRLQKRIEAMCREVEQANRQARFHARVAHIRFNTWHYIDANLWASLVSHIMEGLVRAVARDGKSEEEQREVDAKKEAEVRKALVAELETTKQIKRDVVQDKQRAVQERFQVQSQLTLFAQERANRQVRLTEIRLTDFWSAIRKDPNVQEGMQAVKVLGLPKVMGSLSDLEATVNEAHSLAGRARAVLLELPKPTNAFALVVLVVVLLVVGPVAMWLTEQLHAKHQVLVTFLGTPLQVVAALAAAANALRKPLQAANAGLTKLGEAKERALDLLEAQRERKSDQEVRLERELNELSSKETNASKQLSEADVKIRGLEDKLREIDDGQSLSKYLLERMQTDDYRRHLGLVSTIRRDFEKLAALLDSAAKTTNTKPFERIVLYVDDLDRCPAARVLEVLQAVHLLLAFKLFVVVVGVDPRWLMHSLERSYSAFRVGGRRRGREWLTTPQNYLEKIFQIPFHLKPMEQHGFERLMTTLLPVTDGAVSAPAGSASHGTPRVPEAGAHALATPLGSPPASVPTASSVPSPTAPAPASAAPVVSRLPPHTAAPPAPKVNYAALRICVQERDYATYLLRFIPSPRAANRFSNVYRLLKARLPDREQLAAFEGTPAAPGDFRAVMLLLGIMTAFPESAARVFGRLLAASAQQSSAHFFGDAERAGVVAQDREAFAQCVAPLLGDVPHALKTFSDWTPQVARFSFNAGRALSERSAPL